MIGRRRFAPKLYYQLSLDLSGAKISCGSSQVRLPTAATHGPGFPLAHRASRAAQTAQGVNAPGADEILAPYTPRR